MNIILIEFLPIIVAALAVLAIILSAAFVVFSQRKMINQFLVINRELTHKLMCRNFNEYAELSAMMQTEEPFPEDPIKLPGVDEESLLREVQDATKDIHDFPEELVGTISGEEPAGIRPPMNQ